MPRETRAINTMDELFEAIPEIFETINADPALTIQFAANPLLLVEELGYELSDEMRHFAARRMRFSAGCFAASACTSARSTRTTRATRRRTTT